MEVFIKQADAEKQDDFWKFVEKLNQKAAEKGITQEELDYLLNEE
ncbi:MAG: hypothetical protein V5804_10210 [Mucilaginibacter sp.]